MLLDTSYALSNIHVLKEQEDPSTRQSITFNVSSSPPPLLLPLPPLPPPSFPRGAMNSFSGWHHMAADPAAGRRETPPLNRCQPIGIYGRQGRYRQRHCRRRRRGRRRRSPRRRCMRRSVFLV